MKHCWLKKTLRKLKQSLEVPILTSELYVFTRTDLCFSMWVVCERYTVRSFLIKKNEKWYLRLYLTQIIHSNGKMLFAWRKNRLSKFLMFCYFLLWGKVLCFGTHWQDLRDDYCGRPCRKIYFSGYIWQKSFIQMVKCSFCNKEMFIKVSVARCSH